MPKNLYMKNRGMAFEQIINMANATYERLEIALVQKIPTPWRVNARGSKVISAYPEEKSTLDFRGTVAPCAANQNKEYGYPVQSISFDAKETDDETGLPLKNVKQHQVEYMEKALAMGEKTFILVNSTRHRRHYFIPGDEVVKVYRTWEANKGKRGYNKFKFEAMQPIKQKKGITIDYLQFFRPTPFEGVRF